MSNQFRYGLKLWPADANILSAAINLVELKIFNYIELTRTPNTEVAPFAEYSIPYILHSATEKGTTDFGNPEKTADNTSLMNDNISWADALDAEYIIIHPGEGDIQEVTAFLSKVDDTRIILENMPRYGTNGEHLIGYSPKQLRQLSSGKFGFCFDFAHAIKTALSIGEPIQQFVRGFEGIDTAMFHISDGKFTNLSDEHLPIGYGDFDFGLIKSIIRQNKRLYKKITIETTHNPNVKLSNTIADRIKFEREY